MQNSRRFHAASDIEKLLAQTPEVHIYDDGRKRSSFLGMGDKRLNGPGRRRNGNCAVQHCASLPIEKRCAAGARFDALRETRHLVLSGRAYRCFG